MALTILRVLVLGVVAAAADDVPVTWWRGSRASLPCLVPPPAWDLPIRRPLPLHDDSKPRLRQLTWKKDGVEILASSKRISANGSIEVSRKTEGVYQCSSSLYGGIVLGLPINIRFASIDKQFTKHPENTTARLGQPFAVSCEIKSSPAANITWLRDGLPLPEDPRYFVLAKQLLILDVRHEDAGSYVCIAQNNYAQNRTSYAGSLFIQESSDEMEADFLTVYSEDKLEVPRGGRVELPCPVIGRPRPKLIWEHTPPKGRWSELESVDEVLVQSMETDLEGLYSCIVEGNSGLVKNFQLSLSVPLVITSPPAYNHTVSRTVPRAGTARFNCTPSGGAGVRVEWYKDGELVPASRVRTRDRQLVISGVTSDDAGIYQCFAHTRTSSTTAWASLSVSGGTIEPPRGLRCRPEGAQAVRVSWDKSNATNTPESAYVVQYKTPGFDPLSRQPHKNNEESIPLQEALTNYTFQVRMFGIKTPFVSDMSEKVICQGQGVPIKLVQLYGDTVMVSWEQFAASTPDVEQWILQYRNGSDERNITFGGHVLNYTLHASKSSPLQVRLLGSRTKEWMRQDLSLVPWTSTDETEDVVGHTIPTPYDVETSFISDHSLMVKWTHDVAGAGEEGGNYSYDVCVKSMDGIEMCQESSKTSAFLEKLDPETEYEIRVRAKALTGKQTSEYSLSEHVTTLPAGGLGPAQLDSLSYKFINSSTLQVFWGDVEEEDGGARVLYSDQLAVQLEQWRSLPATGNSVLITGLNPTRRTYVMVSRQKPLGHSQILTVPPQTTDKELRQLQYEHTSSGVRVSWSGAAPRLVRYSQNITTPIEHWNRLNASGGAVVLSNLNLSLPTYVTVSVLGLYHHNDDVLTIPPPAAKNDNLYLVAGLVVGVLILILAAAIAVCLWRKRKRNQSPFRSRRRNTSENKLNEEEGSEMKSVGGRLANGGMSKETGEPLLNGHIHITENPTSKTPNGKIRRGRLEAAFDVSRFDDPNTTLETVLDADTSASTTYNLLDTSRRPDYDVSRSSRDVSSNNSFNKLPDDNMNSELTRSTDLDVDNSKIQPTLQPNG